TNQRRRGRIIRFGAPARKRSGSAKWSAAPRARRLASASVWAMCRRNSRKRAPPSKLRSGASGSRRSWFPSRFTANRLVWCLRNNYPFAAMDHKNYFFLAPDSPDRRIEHSLPRAVLPWGEARARECIEGDTRPNEQQSPRAKRPWPGGLRRFWLVASLLVGSQSAAAR